MRLLSAEYGISTARISQVADERAWSPELAAKIRAKTQARLDRSILDGKLDAKKKMTESEVVEANAQVQTGAVLRHRTDIGGARKLAMMLLDELEIANGDNALLRDLAKLMFAPDANGTDELNEEHNRVIAMPSSVDVKKKLSDTLKTLIGMEREVFGIDGKEAETGGAIESVIKRVMARQSNGH